MSAVVVTLAISGGDWSESSKVCSCCGYVTTNNFHYLVLLSFVLLWLHFAWFNTGVIRDNVVGSTLTLVTIISCHATAHL